MEPEADCYFERWCSVHDRSADPLLDLKGAIYVSDGTDGYPVNNLIYKNNVGGLTNLSVGVSQTGPTGATGLAGQGVPTGGNTGDILVKNSATNYDASWQPVFDMTPLAPYFDNPPPTDIQSAILRMATLLQTLNLGNPIP